MIEFQIKEKYSEKKQKPYYALVAVNIETGAEIILQFISKFQYEKLFEE